MLTCTGVWEENIIFIQQNLLLDMQLKLEKDVNISSSKVN